MHPLGSLLLRSRRDQTKAVLSNKQCLVITAGRESEVANIEVVREVSVFGGTTSRELPSSGSIGVAKFGGGGIFLASQDGLDLGRVLYEPAGRDTDVRAVVRRD